MGPPASSENQEMAEAIKSMLQQTTPSNEGVGNRTARSTPWKRGPNASFAEPSARSLVAHSLLLASPSAFKAPNGFSVTDFTWDEEGELFHWPIDDEALFYGQNLEPSAEQAGRRGFLDLNISMPLLLPPPAEIRVVSNEGENYYHFSGIENPSAQLIFGRGYNSDPAPAKLVSDDPNFPVASSERKSQGNGKGTSNDHPMPTVCDVWASFLNVHLGTIRNCRPDQVSEIARFFKRAMCEAVAVGGPNIFDTPIKIKCKGVYLRPDRTTTDKLETHAYFCSEADKNIFRSIRRRIKYFLLLLLDRFSVGGNGPSFNVGLTPSCKATDFMSVEIRRYEPLGDVDLINGLKLNTSSRGSDVVEYKNTTFPIEASASIQEVRLEMTHARTVDPRWSQQWVLARRMPAYPEGPKRFPNMARYVICPSVTLPRVVYEINKPRETLLKSRFGPLYHLHSQNPFCTPLPIQTITTEEDPAATKLSATAVPFYPLSTMVGDILTTQNTKSQTNDEQRGWQALFDKPNRTTDLQQVNITGINHGATLLANLLRPQLVKQSDSPKLEASTNDNDLAYCRGMKYQTHLYQQRGTQ